MRTGLQRRRDGFDTTRSAQAWELSFSQRIRGLVAQSIEGVNSAQHIKDSWTDRMAYKEYINFLPFQVESETTWTEYK